MPTNRVVHQLLTGRKRKVQNIGASARTIPNRSEIENQNNGTENSRTKTLSSILPPLLLSKTSVSNTSQKQQRQTDYYYTKNVPERQLIESPSTNQIRPQNIHILPSGIKLALPRKELGTESSSVTDHGAHTAKAKPESLDNSSVASPDHGARHRQELEKASHKRLNRYQQQINYRYRRRCIKRGQRQTFTHENGIRIGSHSKNVDAIMRSSDNNSREHEEFRKTESLVATQQRRRQLSRKAESHLLAVPLETKDGSDVFAEQLVRTFLEQRHGKRFTSPSTLLSSSSSIVDDPRMFPVFLLGISAFSHMIEWYDQKRKETEFSQSPLVRDLVLWMKDRQELHAAYTSKKLVRKHVDALNQLAKFQESIENSHETSLQLLAQQREAEKEIEDRRRNRKQSTIEAENTAKARTKSASHPFGLYEGKNVRHRIDSSDKSSFQLEQKSGYQTQLVQRKDKHHSEVKELARKSDNEISMDSLKSKQDNGSRTIIDTAGTGTTGKINLDHASSVDMNEGSIGGKILPSTNEVVSARGRTLSSVPIFSNDVNRYSNAGTHQIDNDSRVLTMPLEIRQPMTKPSSHEANVGNEKRKLQNGICETKKEVQQPNRDFFQVAKYGDAVEHESHWDSTNSDSVSDDMSEVLLSQSRTNPPSRRVTISPSTLSDTKARKPIEQQFKHYSKVDCEGQNQRGDRKGNDTHFDRPLGKAKRHKKSSALKQSTRQSLEKSWVSRAPKRSPTFKQTSLTPSGWVSNQLARNFVKNERLPGMTATAERNQTSAVPSCEGNLTTGKGDFCVQGDGGKDRTPLGTLANPRNNGFLLPTSIITNDERNIAPKTTNKEILIHEFDEALDNGNGSNYCDRDELLRCNRHRARQTPPQTPEDFWELSFRDEKLARKNHEKAK